MKYITLDQLKDAGKEVVDKILEWWKPENGDLVIHKSNNDPKLICGFSKYDSSKIFFSNYPNKVYGFKRDVLPLLTVEQLIDFIEWRTSEKISIYHYSKDYISSTIEGKCYHHKSNYELLQSLWKYACKVATGSCCD